VAAARPPWSQDNKDLRMPTQPGLVLVVDDDAAVRASLKFSLEQEGLTVRAYPDAGALLEQASLPEKGCLVVDFYMPAMDGVDLVRSLRRRHVDLPAILISAKVTPDMRHRAKGAGIRAVLEKPLEDAALLDNIRGALGRA
jgi:FixJ family two-component response regulator